MQFNASRIFNELSPELRLVLLCSNLKSKDKDQDTIDKLIDSGINWPVFTNLVLHHRVYPLAYRYLRTLAHSAVPNEVVAALHELKQDNDRKTLQMITEFVRIMRALEQKGIRTIIIKGFPLAQQLYGDIALRTSRDLDIFVHIEDLGAATKVIEDHGYIWRKPFAVSKTIPLKKWMDWDKHLNYWHPQLEVCIELHWRLDCQGMNIPFSLIDKGRISTRMFGQSINVLGHEELLLYLVIHGSAHKWSRIKWLLDINLMVKKGGYSWEKIYLISDNLGVRPVLNQALILVHVLLENPLPKAIVDLIDKDAKAKKMAMIALRFIIDNGLHTNKSLNEKAIRLYQQKIYEFNLNSKLRGQLSYLSKCFIPSVEDLELISLSRRVYFIYYIISPFTWFYRRILTITKSLTRSLP